LDYVVSTGRKIDQLLIYILVVYQSTYKKGIEKNRKIAVELTKFGIIDFDYFGF